MTFLVLVDIADSGCSFALVVFDREDVVVESEGSSLGWVEDIVVP